VVQGEWSGETVGPDVWETCRELIPVGSVFAFLAENREELFPASMFADMYPSSNGRPSLPPQVLAAAVVLQSLQGLSDFETVQELRCDLRWKAACGLGLYDTAFDPSLLTYFRRRLRHSADPMRIFTKVREVVAVTGVLKGKRRRALDSTVLDDAVATQDTVTQIISAVRRVIREVPGGQETAQRWCTAHDYTDPGKPGIAWDDEQARAALVDALVTDAINLLGHLPGRKLGERAANAVGLPVARDLLADEDEGQELTVLGDSAYGTGGLRKHLVSDGHTLVIKPPPLRQAVLGGFTIDDFLIDTASGIATCPAGQVANLGQVKADGARTAQFKRVCTGCPLRGRCTTSTTGRTLNVHPQHELLSAARAQAATDPAWRHEYRRWRPPVERTIAWLVAKGNRRVPHRGIIANNIHHRAAALRLRRLINLGLTRTSGTWRLTQTAT
jgi:transposase